MVKEGLQGPSPLVFNSWVTRKGQATFGISSICCTWLESKTREENKDKK